MVQDRDKEGGELGAVVYPDVGEVMRQGGHGGVHMLATGNTREFALVLQPLIVQEMERGSFLAHALDCAVRDGHGTKSTWCTYNTV